MPGQIPPPRREHSSATLTQGAGYSGIDGQMLWPLAPSGDGHGKRADALGNFDLPLPLMSPNLGGSQVRRHAGDGHGQVLPFLQPAVAPVRTVGTAKGEVMKLVMLVVFFLLWISTASTLLFLYMDRYLFPG
ncbi:MAG: hypothetical protein ACI80V_002953 [Rhodothermales bacterium]|jgi:hypothetical protein